MQHKQVFSRMNQDQDVRALKPGEYRLLRNGINVQGTTTKAYDAAITSIYGNAILTNAALEANSVVVGFLEDRVNNRAFFAVWNSNNNDTIYQISSSFVVSTVLRTSIFDFSSGDYVDMDILGDILILTNGSNEIKKINVTYAAAGSYGTVTEEKITLIKRPPVYPLYIKRENDATYDNDFLSGYALFMTYRFVYDDEEVSVWAPPAFAHHYETTALNRVEYYVNPSETIPTNVKRIDFAVWLNDSSELIIFESKTVSGGTPPSTDYFYNRSGITESDARSIKWNDFVPKKCKSVKFFKGRLFTFNNTELYSLSISKISGFTVAPVSISTGVASSTTSPGQTSIGTGATVNWTNSGYISSNTYTAQEDVIVDVAITLNVTNVVYLSSATLIRFVLKKNGSTINTSSVINSPTTSGALTLSVTGIELVQGDTLTVVIDSDFTAVTCDVANTSTFAVSGSPVVNQPLKNRGLYSVALGFFDKFGRLIGIRESESELEVPDRTYNTLTSALVYNVSWDLTSVAQADIPMEATHYCLLMTSCLNIGYFIQSRSSDIFYYRLSDSDGTKTYNKTYSADNTGIAIDISHLADFYQIGYTFSQGDRVRLYNTDSTTKDFEIRSQDGRFIYVDNYDVPSIGSTATNRYIEIYQPINSGGAGVPYYEAFFILSGKRIGTSKMAITSPGTGSRAFSTLTSDTSNIKKRLIGDCVYDDGTKGYLGLRDNDYSYASGGYGATAPYSNVRNTLSVGPVISMNYLGQFWNKWIHPIGKRAAVVPQVDSRELNKQSAIRYSNPYIQGSLVNGLNEFDALNEEVLPIENGIGTLLTEAGDVLVALNQMESSSIYIGEGFVNTTSGSSFLSKTDNVVGDTRRYLGGHGTTHPASVVSRDSRVYFYDSRKGCIVRRSQDGLTVISDYGIKGFISYLATLHNADSGNSRIVAGWDPQYDCYCISFFLTGGSYNFTLYFHEKTNSWVCVSDLMPIRFGTLNQYQLAFATGGGVWKQSPEANYNSFFGVAYSRTIEWEWGVDSLMKILEAIEVDAESIYSTAGTNEEIVSVYLEKSGTKQTQINYLDFTQRESVWRSPFFNMITDVNFGSALESKKKSPYKVRGQSFYMVMVYNGTDKNLLKSITSFFRPKMLSNP